MLLITGSDIENESLLLDFFYKKQNYLIEIDTRDTFLTVEVDNRDKVE